MLKACGPLGTAATAGALAVLLLAFVVDVLLCVDVLEADVSGDVTVRVGVSSRGFSSTTFFG